MNPMDLLQIVNTLGTIILILIGSAWLKKYLRQNACC